MTSEHRPLPHEPDLGFRLAWPDDWRALLRTRANVLVTGPSEALEAFVRAARSELEEPIRSAAPGSALRLDGARTLILRDLYQLDDAGQRQLWTWLDQQQNTDTQVVSLTPVSLASLVGASGFDRELYYRLNTIHLEVEQPG